MGRLHLGRQRDAGDHQRDDPQRRRVHAIRRRLGDQYTNVSGGYSTQFTVPACDDVVAVPAGAGDSMAARPSNMATPLTVTVNGVATSRHGRRRDLPAPIRTRIHREPNECLRLDEFRRVGRLGSRDRGSEHQRHRQQRQRHDLQQRRASTGGSSTPRCGTSIRRRR